MSIMSVARHDVDPEYARRQAEAMAPATYRFLDSVATNPDALNSVWSWGRAVLAHRCVLDPTASEQATWDALRLTGDASTAIFVGATGSGVVEAQIGTRAVSFTAPGPNGHADAGRWLHAVWLAVVERDDQRVAWLCEVPETTLRGSGAVYSDHMWPWVESVRTYLRGEPVTPAIFAPAMDGTDPDRSTVTPRDAMLLLNFPPIQLFYYLFRGLPDKFNAALEAALTSYRRYWTMAPDRTDEPDGFIAPSLLGLAVLALKAGMPVNVSSPYLPENFLRGIRPSDAS
ncbi:immunity 49 family protein [Kibdelosporangium phytohabitans]|uniref:Uncharacterized protein n=1 Tax=Kibdelosporangium phytohabitans TaxID=860235 RepID=A0A0N9I6T6_9PSEU|nr:immunity 49 family protein [Kibdelosporangium phytohabitans]ALG10313.1 hypothetical protein AOZ06_28505 [Kibdelosporangium phytohabitans]MBE1461347.1 hypothetical protein [Kibdelosporangium phytohabitans]